MVQVSENCSVLYELDSQFPILNKTLKSTMETVCQLCSTIAIITDNQTGTRLLTGLLSLKENVNALYKYMGVLASHLVNPLIVPLAELKTTLVHVKQDMKASQRLKVLEDPGKNISAY